MAFEYDTPKWIGNGVDGYRLGAIPSPQEEVTKQLVEALSADREQKLRQALINLGWTPPADNNKPI